MPLLDLDIRWRRFHDESRACPCCGQQFNGVFDIGFGHPDLWPHDPLPEGQDAVQVGADKLGTDLCRIEDDRFIRCLLPLPIQGSDEVFHFGAWASVKPENFYRYIDASFGDAVFDGCFAWLMNLLPGIDLDKPVACDLRPGPEGQRPRLFAHDDPLQSAQETGISFDQLLDIYAACGTDIRPHLSQ